MYNQKSVLLDCYSPEKRLLYYAGIYRESTGFNLRYFVSGFVTITFSIMQFMSMLMKIIDNIYELEKVIETLYFFNTQVAFLCKLFPFMLQRHKIKEFDSIVSSEFFNSYSLEQAHFQNNAIIAYRRFANTLRYMCLTTVALFAVFPLMDGNELAVPGWFPVDIKKYRAPIFCFQVFCFFLNAFTTCSIDAITNALISIGSGQFEVLKDNLTNCREINGDVNMTKDEINCVVVERLKRCVQHHNVILNFVDEVESVFSAGIFLLFVNSLMVFCLTGIQLLVVPTKLQFVSLLFYMVSINFEVLIYCWFGHDLMTKSADIGQACYMSRWNECDKKVRVMLFLIMERAKKPICLTAGKLFTLTLSTFAMLLRSAYSYYAVLRRLYAEKPQL